MPIIDNLKLYNKVKKIKGGLLNKLELEEVKKDPLGDDEIRKYLPECKIMKYSKLQEYKSIDDLLPNERDYCIMLYEDSKNNGHWVCLLKYDNNIEYNDSYGGEVDDPLKWTNCKIRKELNEATPYLSHLLNACYDKYNILYNPTKYQTENPKIATCGRHCIFRILKMKNNNMNLSDYYKFMKKMKKKYKTYDNVVSNFIDIIE